MAALTTSSLDKRRRDLSYPGKRKLSFPAANTRTRDQWPGDGQPRLLEQYEKRKKIAQDPKMTLLPVKTISVLFPTRYISENSGVLNASPNYSGFEHISRSYALPPPSFSGKALGTDYSSFAANVYGGRFGSEPGGSFMNSSKMTWGYLGKWRTPSEYMDRHSVGNSSESRGAIAGHYNTSLPRALAQDAKGGLRSETYREPVDNATELHIPSVSETVLEVRETLAGDTSVSPQRSRIQVMRFSAEDSLPARNKFQKESMAYRDKLVGNSSYTDTIAGHFDEGPNRARAQGLKGNLTVEEYRRLVNAPTRLSEDLPEWKSSSDQTKASEDVPAWRRLYQSIPDPKQKGTDKEIAFVQAQLEALQLRRPPSRKAEKKIEEDPKLEGAFTPLSDEAAQAVDEALEGSSRSEVLVLHEKSNIEVTEAVMQCLLPGAWLNDEVINVYMELLKEREAREHNRFLKCHFFNTFFYNKLYKDKRNYDYKAIRRWTTAKKLGYSLSECDKILVPIHQDIHWCLAVINIKEKKLEYLDSLKGGDRAVLEVLAKYISDEARDKSGKDLDATTWERSFPKEIPEQLNGCDCGMFMLKYADFHSRDAPLSFTQDHMDYFRRKMVWEILQLEAT